MGAISHMVFVFCGRLLIIIFYFFIKLFQLYYTGYITTGFKKFESCFKELESHFGAGTTTEHRLCSESLRLTARSPPQKVGVYTLLACRCTIL